MVNATYGECGVNDVKCNVRRMQRTQNASKCNNMHITECNENALCSNAFSCRKKLECNQCCMLHNAYIMVQ